MEHKKRTISHYLLHDILPASLILFLIIYFIASPEFSVQTLLTFTPKNPLAAAVVLLLLYALKSATIVFPLIILELTAGRLFSPVAALLVNYLGLLIMLTVPYWIGRLVGSDAVQKLVKRYPKFHALLDMQHSNSFFLCFFFRIIGGLPADVVTMYFGATKTPYFKNLIGGSFGMLPGMILATLIGETIQNPQSPMFWISVVLKFVLAGVSALMYYLYCRNMAKKE